MKRAGLAAVLLAMACTQSVPDLSSEPSRFERTDRKTWSKYGWEGLRWGMGPGDVQVHLGPKGMNVPGTFEPEPKLPIPRMRSFVVRGSGRTVGGEKSILVFGFMGNSLFTVVERPDMPEADFPRYARWATNARAELVKRWGQPDEEKGASYLQATQRDAGQAYAASWTSDKFTGGVMLVSRGDPEIEDASVRAVDPKRAQKARAAVREEAASGGPHKRRPAMEE